MTRKNQGIRNTTTEEVRASHRRAIVERLRKGPCKTATLAAITHRFGARVMELRQMGYEIACNQVCRGNWSYHLTGEPGKPGKPKVYERSGIFLIFSGTDEFHGGAQDLAAEFRGETSEAIARARLEITDHGKTWVHVYSPGHGIVYDSE